MKRNSLVTLVSSCQSVLEVISERGTLSMEEHRGVLLQMQHAIKDVENQLPSEQDISLLAVEIDTCFKRHHNNNSNTDTDVEFNYESFIQEVYIEVNGSHPCMEQVSSIKHQLLRDFNPRLSLYHQCRNLCVTNSDDLLSGLLAL